MSQAILPTRNSCEITAQHWDNPHQIEKTFIGLQIQPVTSLSTVDWRLSTLRNRPCGLCRLDSAAEKPESLHSTLPECAKLDQSKSLPANRMRGKLETAVRCHETGNSWLLKLSMRYLSCFNNMPTSANYFHFSCWPVSSVRKLYLTRQQWRGMSLITGLCLTLPNGTSRKYI